MLLLVFLFLIQINIYFAAFEGHRKECTEKFPKKIPKWEELPNICNNVHQFKVRSKCDIKNCSDCIPPWSKHMLDENKEIKQWQENYRKTSKSRRIELLNLLTSHNINPDDNDPVILIVINRGYLYLFYNFLCSLDYNEIAGIKERILVIPTDKKTKKLLESAGVLTYYPTFLGEWLLNRIDHKMAASFALGAHRWTISFQIAFLTDLINLGYNVILQDSDLVWLRNAVTYLQQSHFDHLDIQMSVDGRNDFRGPGNSGFVFIKHGCKTKLFVNTMIHLIGLVMVGRSDQILWNMLIDENIFRQIHFETLDTSYFICGYQVNLERGVRGGKLPDTALLIHASWTTDQFDKVEKFYIADAWYFSEDRCPQLYEYDLLPDLAERKWHIRDKTQPQEKKFKQLGIFRDTTNGVYEKYD